MKKLKNSSKGITLVALVITVIVLIILAATSISLVLGEHGLLKMAKDAKENTERESALEAIQIQVLGSYDKYADLNLEELTSNLQGIGATVTGNAFPIRATLNGASYTIDEDGNVTKAGESTELTIKMTLKTNTDAEGTEVKITKDNYAEHLGKIVTKYTGPATVTVGSKTYNVSTQYRLYWIDWNNKYGDGEGTIYLKADVSNNSNWSYGLEKEPASNSEETSEISLIKKLNPELYKNGYNNAPAKDNSNMQAVRWLLNSINWEGLKVSSYSSKTNYIVGAPSLEMMVDSYNIHYGLTGDNPATGSRNINSPRTKLFYTFPLSDSGWFYNNGYSVGPSRVESIW